MICLLQEKKEALRATPKGAKRTEIQGSPSVSRTPQASPSVAGTPNLSRAFSKTSSVGLAESPSSQTSLSSQKTASPSATIDKGIGFVFKMLEVCTNQDRSKH